MICGTVSSLLKKSSKARLGKSLQRPTPSSKDGARSSSPPPTRSLQTRKYVSRSNKPPKFALRRVCLIFTRPNPNISDDVIRARIRCQREEHVENTTPGVHSRPAYTRYTWWPTTSQLAFDQRAFKPCVTSIRSPRHPFTCRN